MERIQTFENEQRLGIPHTVTEAHYKRAVIVKSSMVHPDTGEIIPAPFRFSAFVPMNMVIVLGMIAPNPSIGSTIFWQFINQSYNVAVNHANRNASNEMTNAQIGVAYAGAVTTSCGVAVGLGALTKRIGSWPPALQAACRLTVPYAAVASAGVLNVVLMRRNELQLRYRIHQVFDTILTLLSGREGITVCDADGKDLGKSPAAGAVAIRQVAISRAVGPIPAVFLPAILMNAFTKRYSFMNQPRYNVPVNLGIIAMCLQLGLPTAIAIFPQTASLPVDQVEERFRNLRRANGSPVTEVYFNKGL